MRGGQEGGGERRGGERRRVQKGGREPESDQMGRRRPAGREEMELNAHAMRVQKGGGPDKARRQERINIKGGRERASGLD